MARVLLIVSVTQGAHMARKTTPAIAAGLTDHVWSVDELMREAARCS